MRRRDGGERNSRGSADGGNSPVSRAGLFITFLRIGAFTFGGGLAMIGVIRRELVIRRALLTDEEMSDMVSVATAFPGPIAINMAILLGHRFGGRLGALVSVLGVVLPSVLVILGILILFDGALDQPAVRRFFRGAAAAVAAQIVFSGFVFGKVIRKDILSLGIAALALAAAFFLNLHPALIILMAAVVRYFLPSGERKK